MDLSCTVEWSLHSHYRQITAQTLTSSSELPQHLGAITYRLSEGNRRPRFEETRISRMMEKVWLPLVVAVLGVGLRAVAADGAPAPVAPQAPLPMYWFNLHSWLMWASFGFLMPLATILIRYSRPQRDPTRKVSPARASTLYYAHIVLQSLAVGLAAAGFAVLWKTEGNLLIHTHERLGLVVLIIVLMMPFIGFARPNKGTQLRPYWFFIHWLLGTGAVILGIANIFIGIFIYQWFIPKKIPSLNTAFSISVAFIGLIYLLQDRVSYMVSQGKPQGQESDKSKLPSKSDLDLETSVEPQTA